MSQDPRPIVTPHTLRNVMAVVLAGALLAAVTGAAYLLYRLASAPPPPNPNLSLTQRLYLEQYLGDRAAALQGPSGSAVGPQPFTINAGEGASAIAANLAAAGIVTDSDLFVNYLTYNGLDGSLITGSYTLDPARPIPDIAAALSRHGTQDTGLSFLPGWRLEEMATYLDTVRPAAIDPETFLDIAQRRRPIDLGRFPFLASLPADASLEGYLFPGAYPVAADTTAEGLVVLMLEEFGRQVTPEMRQSYGTLGLSVREAVIVASIVEKEALLPEEKPLIAGVFLNRLRAAMPLQADPTVQYALGYSEALGTWWKSPLDPADLQVDSPYNTYIVPALPPGPITNPGPESLRAVANPLASSYLFFVLGCDAARPGAHVFSTTYDEHLAAIAACR